MRGRDDTAGYTMRGPGFLATSVVVVPAVALSHPAPATAHNACLGTRGAQESCTWTADKVDLDCRYEMTHALTMDSMTRH